MPALGDAAVFPFPPDGNTRTRVARILLTDIQTADDGTETRIVTRDAPTRRMSFTAVFGNATEAGAFRALWYAAPQALRFLVPLWREQAEPSEIAGNVVTCDTTNRRFVVGARAAILWQEQAGEIVYEVVDVDAVDDDALTLADDVETDFAIGQVFCYPLMGAWLEPPTITERSYVDVVPLVFHEELPGIAGIDPAVEGLQTPTVASVSIWNVHGNNPYNPSQRIYVLRAVDADGMPIVDPTATWTLSASDPGRVITPSLDGQSARLDVASEWLTGAFSIEATVGGVTASLAVV